MESTPKRVFKSTSACMCLHVILKVAELEYVRLCSGIQWIQLCITVRLWKLNLPQFNCGQASIIHIPSKSASKPADDKEAIFCHGSLEGSYNVVSPLLVCFREFHHQQVWVLGKRTVLKWSALATLVHVARRSWDPVNSSVGILKPLLWCFRLWLQNPTIYEYIVIKNNAPHLYR